MDIRRGIWRFFFPFLRETSGLGIQCIWSIPYSFNCCHALRSGYDLRGLNTIVLLVLADSCWLAFVSGILKKTHCNIFGDTDSKSPHKHTSPLTHSFTCSHQEDTNSLCWPHDLFPNITFGLKNDTIKLRRTSFIQQFSTQHMINDKSNG